MGAKTNTRTRPASLSHNQSISRIGANVKQNIHRELRKICDYEMDELIRKEKAAYYRQWRQNNPEKAKESQRRYWERKARERMEREQQEQNGNQ